MVIFHSYFDITRGYTLWIPPLILPKLVNLVNSESYWTCYVMPLLFFFGHGGFIPSHQTQHLLCLTDLYLSDLKKVNIVRSFGDDFLDD